MVVNRSESLTRHFDGELELVVYVVLIGFGIEGGLSEIRSDLEIYDG